MRRENRGLRALVVQLSKVIIRNIVDQRGILDTPSKEAVQQLLVTMTPNEVAPLLREVSLHCAHASRDSLEDRTARELEVLSVELSDAAQNLESLFLAHRSDE